MDWARKNLRRLHDLLHRRGWKRQDAEDVIQDAFLRMQAYCNEGGQVRNTEAFLVRTVLNLSTNSRTRDRSHLFVDESAEEVSVLLGVAPAPDELLAAEERLREVSALIDAMTPRTREIFLLHYIDNYSYPQIARQLGISVSAVEKHVARAMLALTEEGPGHG
jgi:RNA polymerase sigma factor (sigma-70 family)